jgi:hypothetical protein
MKRQDDAPLKNVIHLSSRNAFEKSFDRNIRQLDHDIKQFQGRMDELREFLLSRRSKPNEWEKF